MSNNVRTSIRRAFVAAVLLGPAVANAFVISLDQDDFTTAPEFNTVETFAFSIDIAAPLAVGTYSNPTLNSVNYSVSGSLEEGSPSGFPGFALGRSIGGAEFYSQGSSLEFEIAAGADLSDGLQLSELAGASSVFVFNGREVETGRYHPGLLQLNSDGTGSIRNSNNSSPTVANPGSGQTFDINAGDEYITNLSFDPAALTLAAPVPLPPAVLLLGGAIALLTGKRRLAS